MAKERGDHVAAEQIRVGELAIALDGLRAEPGSSEQAIQARLEQVMTLEEERVANAALLAELLAPMLIGRGAVAPIAAAAFHEGSIATDSASVPRPSPRAAPANIADFIDEMLAQERAEPHPQRRAS